MELYELFHFPQGDITRALARTGAILGRMSASEANSVAWAAKRAPTLSEERQDVVWENLHDLR